MDYSSPEIWEKWIKLIRTAQPSLVDFVFSSEEYGNELARRLDAETVVVDENRSAFPVSGTEVREAPLAHWEFLPDCVREYFTAKGLALRKQDRPGD